MKSNAKRLLAKRKWFVLLVLCVVSGVGFLLSSIRVGKSQAAEASRPLQQKPIAAAFSLSLADLLELPRAELEHGTGDFFYWPPHTAGFVGCGIGVNH